MYRKSAKYGSTYPLSLVILSEAKNHLPQHSADEQHPPLRPEYDKALGPCNTRTAAPSLSMSLTPYALRTTHYAVPGGTPARGGYPIPSIAR